jgi:hypothetical protein
VLAVKLKKSSCERNNDVELSATTALLISKRNVVGRRGSSSKTKTFVVDHQSH